MVNEADAGDTLAAPAPLPNLTETSKRPFYRRLPLPLLIVGGVLLAGLLAAIIVPVAIHLSQPNEEPVNVDLLGAAAATKKLDALLREEPLITPANGLHSVPADVLQKVVDAAREIPDDQIGLLPAEQQQVVRLGRLQARAGALARLTRLNKTDIIDLYRVQQEASRLQLSPSLLSLLGSHSAELARVTVQADGSLAYTPSSAPADLVSSEGSSDEVVAPGTAVDSDDAMQVDVEEASSAFDSTAYAESPTVEDVLQRAKAIVTSTTGVSEADIKFMQDHGHLVRSRLGATELAGVTSDLLIAFHRNNQRGDETWTRPHAVSTLQKGATATVDDVANVAKFAWRAQALGLSTEHDVQAFLAAKTPTTDTDLARLDRLVAGQVPYMSVTDADVAFVRTTGQSPLAVHRMPLVRRFLKQHCPANRTLAKELETILALSAAARSPQQKTKLKEHAWNVFGLQINRALHTYTDPFATVTPRPTLSNMLHEMTTRVGQLQTSDTFSHNDWKDLQNIYEQIVKEIAAQSLDSQYPEYMRRQTVEEFALPVLLSRFDMECAHSDLATNPSVPILFKAVQRCMLPGHPRRLQFARSAKVESARAAAAPAITDSATYGARVKRLIRHARLLMMLVPTDDSCLGYLFAAISHARNAFKAASAAAEDKTRLALPGTACEPLDVQRALAHHVRPYAVQRLRSALHATFDQTSIELSADDLARLVGIVGWFRRMAIDLPGVETSSWAQLDALQATAESVRAYGLQRALDDFFYTARTLQSKNQASALHIRWTRAIADSKFGKLASAQNRHDLNGVSTEADTETAIISILKDDMFTAIKANDDAETLRTLNNLKRVLTILGRTSKRYHAGVTTSALAKAAYEASSQIPLNRANKLEAKLRTESARPEADLAALFRTYCLPVLVGLRQALNADQSVWTEPKRAFFVAVSDVTQLQTYFNATPQMQQYIELVALMNSVFAEYSFEVSDQAKINSLHAKLNTLKAQIDTIVVPAGSALTLPTIPPVPKVAISGSNSKRLCDLAENAYPYTFCLSTSDTDCLQWPPIDFPNENEFLTAFYSKAWLNEQSDLYAFNPRSLNKNLLFHFFSSVPFDPSFSPVPAVGEERNMPQSFPRPIPAPLIAGLLEVDTHLRALSTDPIHLILWTIRMQQAFYIISDPHIQTAMVDAYKRVRQAVRTSPIVNELTNLLWDFLKLPVTRDAADDTQREPPRLPHVAELFEFNEPKDVERDANADPSMFTKVKLPLNPQSPGRLAYMYDALITAMEKFRFRFDDYTTIPNQLGFRPLLELQVLASLNPEIMLPKMHQWMHTNRTDLCGADNRMFDLLKGYCIQNRSTYLYDDLHLMCGKSLDQNDPKRPVPHGTSCYTGFLVNVSSHGSTLMLDEISAAKLSNQAKDGAADFASALGNLQPVLKMIDQEWNVFLRQDRSVRYNGQPGIDAGGLSRDLVGAMWSLLSGNPARSPLFYTGLGFTPNIYTDPRAAKLLVAAIVYGFRKSVAPGNYLPRSLHDMIFATEPPSDNEVLVTYLKPMADLPKESSLDIDGETARVLVGTKKQLTQAFCQTDFMLRRVFNPTGGLAFGGSMCAFELYDDDDPYRASLASYKHAEGQKHDMYQRFRMFMMYMQEQMSRATAFDMIPLLHGRDTPGARLESRDELFDFLTPKPLEAESIVKLLRFENCNQKYNVTASEGPIVIDMSRLPMRDNTHKSFEELVKHWLRTTWGKMPAPLPADIIDQIKRATDETAKKALISQREQYLNEVRRVQTNLKMFLATITGSTTLPHGRTIDFKCVSSGGAERAFQMMIFFAHTCFFSVDVPPVQSEEAFDNGFSLYLQDTSPKFTKG